jgi:uncharacterized protein
VPLTLKSSQNPQARLEPATGRITGYASLFNVADDTGDIVEKGAFAASLLKKGVGGIKMLWQHDPAEPIGTWLHIVEDDYGLKVTGQICQETQRGRDCRALLLSGACDGLSIGFKTARSRKNSRSPHRYLAEVDLWEISLVTFPALKGARISSVKSL